MSPESYQAKQIQVLKGLQAVRKRPGMYIGDVNRRGLYNMCREVIDNSIDEVLAGACTRITVTLRGDGVVSVEDNGRGIPVDRHPTERKPAVEVVMTMLHAGSKFGGGGYKVASGLHGVGVSVVNGLSEWMEVEVCRDGKRHFQRYEAGKKCAALKVIGRSKRTGTKVTYRPDPDIFEIMELDRTMLVKRLRELAFLNPGVKITLVDEVNDETHEFHYKGGLVEFVKFINEGKEPLHRKVIHFEGTRDTTHVEVAIQYNTGFRETIVSFANNICTTEGGTHESGLKTALTRCINNYARKNRLLKEKDANLTGDDVRDGIAAVISVKLINPTFESQTKIRLGNTEVDGVVNSVVTECLNEFLEENPSVARHICQKAITAAQARIAARQAADLIKRKSALEDSSLPGKLADCTEKDPRECEIFIVEGDSAGGSAKQGRDRRYQAVLPLRGKIINSERHRLDKILNNLEIRAMITALGTGITDKLSVNGNGEENGNGDENGGGQFDLDKLRYDRIIIMTDADVDGSHIRTLLLTFLFRYMKPLIEEGHVYIAQPPLFGVKTGRQTHYAHDETELNALLERLRTRSTTVARFKGLGEMDADELRNTTMDRESRRLLRITLEDAMEADRIISTLMGSQVEARKDFITAHAKLITDLDL